MLNRNVTESKPKNQTLDPLANVNRNTMEMAARGTLGAPRRRKREQKFVLFWILLAERARTHYYT